MSDSDSRRFDSEDLRLYAPPGTVSVSLAALEMARALLSTVKTQAQAD